MKKIMGGCFSNQTHPRMYLRQNDEKIIKLIPESELELMLKLLMNHEKYKRRIKK